MAAASPYGRGLLGLLKQGWNEIPSVMGSSVLALVGIGFGIAAVINYERNGGMPSHKYKYDYVVYRPDDPRAQKLKRN